MRRLLLVTRNFAPTSHVSVERAIKLVKYLPEFGWRPTVLTGGTASAGLPSDPGLLEQMGDVEIVRSRAPEFSLFYARLKGVTALRDSVVTRGAASCIPSPGWSPTRSSSGIRSPSTRRCSGHGRNAGTSSSPRRSRRPRFSSPTRSPRA